jgi:hypothetical protein
MREKHHQKVLLIDNCRLRITAGSENHWAIGNRQFPYDTCYTHGNQGCLRRFEAARWDDHYPVITDSVWAARGGRRGSGFTAQSRGGGGDVLCDVVAGRSVPLHHYDEENAD